MPVIGDVYQYDSHGDTFVCGLGSPWRGVNIRVIGVTSLSARQMVDQVIDGGDGGDCGRIKYGGLSDSLYYELGANVSDF